MDRNFAYEETVNLRDFYKMKFNELEVQLSAGYGNYNDILEHESLALKIHKLNLEINEILNRIRAKKPLWKKLFRK